MLTDVVKTWICAEIALTSVNACKAPTIISDSEVHRGGSRWEGGGVGGLWGDHKTS